MNHDKRLRAANKLLSRTLHGATGGQYSGELIKIFSEFVSVKPKKMNKFMLLYHPIFESEHTFDHDKQEFVEVTKHFRALISQVIAKAAEKQSLATMTFLIRAPYRLAFLEKVTHLIGKAFTLEEYSQILISAYQQTEFPNFEYFIQNKQHDLKMLFDKAMPQCMMSAKELEVFDKLPNNLVLYRGINKSVYYDAMSWTTSKAQAEWFANRFHGLGTVVVAKIHKDDVYCYKEHENEIIVDFTKLTDVTHLNKGEK